MCATAESPFPVDRPKALVPPPFSPPRTRAAARKWTPGETLAMAQEGCVRCGGTGFIRRTETPCHCVERAIYRACFGRFRAIQNSPSLSRISIERMCRTRQTWKVSYGRKSEEFCADFVLIARRTLSREQWKLFRVHKLLGADWRLCTRMLGMSRGNFFHEVYRIEQRLGRAFAETEPFGLFPPAEYFGSAVRTA